MSVGSEVLPSLREVISGTKAKEITELLVSPKGRGAALELGNFDKGTVFKLGLQVNSLSSNPNMGEDRSIVSYPCCNDQSRGDGSCFSACKDC